MRSLTLLAAVATLACGFSANAVDATSGPGKPMKMEEPMPIPMKKPGMKKGDVKKAADKKEREMTPVIEKESRAKRTGG
jgi:hypothetical protein